MVWAALILATSPAVSASTLPIDALWVFGLIAALASIVGIVLAAPKLWNFLSRFVQTVDIISGLDTRLKKMDEDNELKLGLIREVKGDLSKHISDVVVTQARWNELEVHVTQLLDRQGIVVEQVQHNGGSSMKDDIYVLKEALRSALGEDALTTAQLSLKQHRAEMQRAASQSL